MTQPPPPPPLGPQPGPFSGWAPPQGPPAWPAPQPAAGRPPPPGPAHGPAGPWFDRPAHPGARWAAEPPRRLAGDGPPATPGAPRRLAEPPEPRGGGWAITMVASVGIVLAGLVAAAVLPNLLFGGYQPDPGVSPSALPAPPATAPGSTARPSASPVPTMPARAADVLQRNPIYALTVPADCPGQNRPDGRAAFRRQVRGLMDCVNAAWRTALAGTGVTFAKPRVRFYDTRTSSPCGRLGTAFPAAYCSANRTMYFSIASFEQGGYYRLAVAHFVLHEYAHHVQELAGILGARWALDESAAVTTRRVELQAHCLAHYHLTHADLGFDSLDRADAEYQFSWTSDPGGHGSVKAERFWGRRGMDGSRIGACNTWKARPARVK